MKHIVRAAFTVAGLAAVSGCVTDSVNGLADKKAGEVAESTTGSISGQVRDAPDTVPNSVPIVGARVGVLLGDSASAPEDWTEVASTVTDAAGAFAVDLLDSGSYYVRVDPPAGLDVDPLIIPGVGVRAGEDTHLDLLLAATGGGGGGDGTARLWVTGPWEMTVGDVATFSAMIFTAEADTVPAANATWTSTNPAAATVSFTSGAAQTAEVTAVAAGSTLIFAHSGDLWDSVYVVVKDGDSGEPVSTIELTPANPTVAVGDTTGIVAILRDAQGRELSNRTVSWTTSNAAVVTIESSFGHAAQLRGVSAGSATITAGSEGKSATATVTVTN
ncbi:MAG TPA: Ig-like domain-containing protein [Gemmatimonadales bacterium]